MSSRTAGPVAIGAGRTTDPTTPSRSLTMTDQPAGHRIVRTPRVVAARPPAPPAPAAAQPVDRAAVLREAADALDESERLRDLTDDHMHDVHAAATELRRMAAEAGDPEAPAQPGRPVPAFAGRMDNGQPARADLLNTFASWMFTTRFGSKEAADQILGKHRAEVLREAADAIETAQHRRDDLTNERLGYLDDKTFHQHIAVHRSGRLLRHMAGETPAATDEAQPDVCGTCHAERCETCHACRCNKGADNTCGHPDCPGTRVRHSGPDTEFCVLCLSGEHERVDEEAGRG